ncbi:hypothetical protein BH23BAC2_BH23BAC2_00220 [soil metagenome]
MKLKKMISKSLSQGEKESIFFKIDRYSKLVREIQSDIKKYTETFIFLWQIDDYIWESTDMNSL